jgi:hypothetical protein
MSKDGTYTVVLDPNVANTLVMAGNTLVIPASSVCDLDTFPLSTTGGRTLPLG